MVGDTEIFAEARSHCEQLLIHTIDNGSNLSFRVSSLGRIYNAWREAQANCPTVIIMYMFNAGLISGAIQMRQDSIHFFPFRVNYLFSCLCVCVCSFFKYNMRTHFDYHFSFRIGVLCACFAFRKMLPFNKKVWRSIDRKLVMKHTRTVVFAQFQ